MRSKIGLLSFLMGAIILYVIISLWVFYFQDTIDFKEVSATVCSESLPDGSSYTLVLGCLLSSMKSMSSPSLVHNTAIDAYRIENWSSSMITTCFHCCYVNYPWDLSISKWFLFNYSAGKISYLPNSRVFTPSNYISKTSQASTSKFNPSQSEFCLTINSQHWKQLLDL